MKNERPQSDHEVFDALNQQRAEALGTPSLGPIHRMSREGRAEHLALQERIAELDARMARCERMNDRGQRIASETVKAAEIPMEGQKGESFTPVKLVMSLTEEQGHHYLEGWGRGKAYCWVLHGEGERPCMMSEHPFESALEAATAGVTSIFTVLITQNVAKIEAISVYRFWPRLPGLHPIDTPAVLLGQLADDLFGKWLPHFTQTFTGILQEFIHRSRYKGPVAFEFKKLEMIPWRDPRIQPATEKGGEG